MILVFLFALLNVFLYRLYSLDKGCFSHPKILVPLWLGLLLRDDFWASFLHASALCLIELTVYGTATNDNSLCIDLVYTQFKKVFLISLSTGPSHCGSARMYVF